MAEALTKRALEHDAQANAELESAIDWYDQQSPSAGNRLVAAIGRTVASIIERPRLGRRINVGQPHMEIRERRVPGFPYTVMYLLTPSAIRILAFAHSHRRPGYWQNRI